MPDMAVMNVGHGAHDGKRDFVIFLFQDCFTALLGGAKPDLVATLSARRCIEGVGKLRDVAPQNVGEGHPGR